MDSDLGTRINGSYPSDISKCFSDPFELKDLNTVDDTSPNSSLAPEGKSSSIFNLLVAYHITKKLSFSYACFIFLLLSSQGSQDLTFELLFCCFYNSQITFPYICLDVQDVFYCVV